MMMMMMKKVVMFLSLLPLVAQAFVAKKSSSSATRTTTRRNKQTALFAQMDRRQAIIKPATVAATAAVASSLLGGAPFVAFAEEAATTKATTKKIVVAGATGQTGRRILERLAAKATADSNNLTIIGGVRNVAKATESLSTDSTVVRGAMVQRVGSVDTSSSSAVQLTKLNVVDDSVGDMAKAMEGADALVIATGFVPSNPLKMNEAAHAVDNIGTCKLVDAAKATGTIKKIVMVSSILTNGRNWGQESSPGFVITNAFGKVLDEKIVAEQYLRSNANAASIDYTIVRPGGLKAKPPTGALKISGEDTLNAGEISRDLVADVCVASLFDSKASNKVLEIVEDDGEPPRVFNGLVM